MAGRCARIERLVEPWNEQKKPIMVSSAARPSTGPLLSALGLRGGANSFARMGELRAAADHMQIEPVDRGTPARRWQCPRRSALFTWLLLIMSPSSAFLALSAPVLAQGVSAAYSVTGTVLLVVATVLMALTSFTDPGKVPLPPANPSLRSAGLRPATNHQQLINNSS